MTTNLQFNTNNSLFGDGVRRTAGDESRRYNLLAARLIGELIKNSLGPKGLQKIFIDILGEVTITKDGAAFLRKIDVEHPAAKVLIEASNAVDNEVGDGTTSVVVLAGALAGKAEELLDMGIPPSAIVDGYTSALEISLDTLHKIAEPMKNSDREVMEMLANTCLNSKTIGSAGDQKNIVARLVVDAILAVTDFKNGVVEVDDIKIEEKLGNMSDTELVRGIVIDKTIDSSAMPRMVENARILLIDACLDNERTRANAEISISSPDQISAFLDEESRMVLSKVEKITRAGVNVVISRKGISPLAQDYLAKSRIISIRRVKENDLLWLEKATGAKVIADLDNITDEQVGFAGRVYEKFVGDDKMVFVNGCKDPKSVTLLLRAGSKNLLDEYHRSILDAIYVLRNFIAKPFVVAGGGAAEAIIAGGIRQAAVSIPDREQLVVLKFAEALEEIPLTLARNSGMDVIDSLTQLRAKNSYPKSMTTTPLSSDDAKKNSNGKSKNSEKISKWYGINSIERKVDEMFSQGVIEPCMVKEQVLKTAVEVTNMLLRIDDVLMAKPTMYSHTHADGTRHTHEGGHKVHDHFDRIGKEQRPMHHYY